MPSTVAQVLDTGQEQRHTQTYDASGRLQSLTDPAGRTFSFLYAANGIDLTSIRNNLLNSEQVAAMTYNSIHLPLTYTDYAGQTYSLTYNAFGQLTSLKRPDGATMNLTYDAQGFLMQVARAGTAYQETYSYDAANRLRTWTSTDGYTLTLDYDNLDRLTKITYPDGTSDSVVIDRLDVIEDHDRMGRVTKYSYDPDGQLLYVTDPANRTTVLSWCACGVLSQLTDPLGHQTTWLRDGLNRVVGRQINGQTSVLYDYDGSGRLIRRTDALNQATVYSYNVDDTLAAINYQNAAHPTPGVQYQWDFFYPRVAQMTDGFATTTYSYNPTGVPGAGHLASIAAISSGCPMSGSPIACAPPEPNHTISFQYDGVGRQVGRAVDGVSLTTSYDALDRVATSTSPLGTFTASYVGSSHRVTALTYPNGQGPTLSYLDAAHDFQLARLRWGPAAGSFNLSQFDYSYDIAHDQRLGITWHDASNQAGRFFNFTYDAAKQLLGRQQTTDPSQPPTSVLHLFAFGYDQAGNRTSETIDNTLATATFDGANQLVAIERGLTLKARAAIAAARARTDPPRPDPRRAPGAGRKQGGQQ
jgi:YD repeat-containing protein